MYCISKDLNNLIQSKITYAEEDKVVPWITEEKGQFKATLGSFAKDQNLRTELEVTFFVDQPLLVTTEYEMTVEIRNVCSQNIVLPNFSRLADDSGMYAEEVVANWPDAPQMLDLR